MKQKKGKRTIHFNGDSMNTELLFQTINSVNQLCVHGAVANWCHQFDLTEEEKGRISLPVDNKILTELKPEEVQLLVSPPTITTGNRSFEALAGKIQLTQLCEKAYFQYRVAAGKQCKIRPDGDDGWRTSHSCMRRILEFSIFSANPSLGSYSRRHNHWFIL